MCSESKETKGDSLESSLSRLERFERNETNESASVRSLKDLLDAESTAGEHCVAIIATAQDEGSVHPALMRCAILDQDIKLSAPDAEGRASILEAIFEQVRERSGASKEIEMICKMSEASEVGAERWFAKGRRMDKIDRGIEG